MNINELTYNQLDPQDFIPVDWCSIDLTKYSGEYSADLEVCFKLNIWNLQCQFGKLVNQYINSLSYGIDCGDLLLTLKKFKAGLEVLNSYDPRDILMQTTNYNIIPFTTITKILSKLNSY